MVGRKDKGKLKVVVTGNKPKRVLARVPIKKLRSSPSSQQASEESVNGPESSAAVMQRKAEKAQGNKMATNLARLTKTVKYLASQLGYDFNTLDTIINKSQPDPPAP